jgi:hypothetical protein
MKDKVVTAAGSRLQIMFADESVISQGEKSEMTIDEYVYSPAKKDDNACSLGLARGVFRVVTDRITKINPDRFKVKTKMATIGIRGCDLGFDLRPNEERIYVISLRHNERVQVERLGQAIGGELGHVLVENSRTLTIVPDGQAMETRQIPWDELLRLFENVRPQPDPTIPPEVKAVPTEADQVAAAGNAAGSQGTSGGAIDNTFVELDQNLGVAPPVQPAPAPVTLDVPPPEPPPEPAPLPGPVGPTEVLVDMGGGLDWCWGVWTLNGVEQRVDFYSDSVIAPTDFAALSSGARLFNLSGLGDASAMVSHGGTLTRLTGYCMLNVQLGLSVAPNWDGTFSMNNYPAMDTLSFDAGGTLQTDGAFTGNQTSYNLRINGATFDRTMITAESIGGHTVGTGIGTTPITGAFGSYTFTHGSAAQVNGGFGADFGR